MPVATDPAPAIDLDSIAANEHETTHNGEM